MESGCVGGCGGWSGVVVVEVFELLFGVVFCCWDFGFWLCWLRPLGGPGPLGYGVSCIFFLLLLSLLVVFGLGCLSGKMFFVLKKLVGLD